MAVQKKNLQRLARSICQTQFPTKPKDSLLQFENNIEVSGLGVLSTFRLSQTAAFKAPLDAVLSNCGTMFSRKQNSHLMEVNVVALKIAWEFSKLDPDVGVFELRFNCIYTAFELPFQVNLRKLNSLYQQVVFDPQIQKGATISFGDSGPTVTIQKSGKIAIRCTSDTSLTVGTPDGKLEDDNLPNTLAAATSVSEMARRAMIQGSEKPRVPASDDSPSKSKQEREFERDLDKQNPYECYERRLALFFMAHTNIHGLAAASRAMEKVRNSDSRNPICSFTCAETLPARSLGMRQRNSVEDSAIREEAGAQGGARKAVPRIIRDADPVTMPVESSSFHKRVQAAAMGICHKITDFDAYPLRSRIRALSHANEPSDLQ
ncbi:hypothetical protein RvY_13152 [Ramazzottius varieornatus]|uniref:Uncharacterized protein n=1 Tax=Ramazzottius varieornatus TaxID=947166 RepID=A0A1D1VNT5_RAMVA|nr:hypothetical protein RvY_13152 [Ramazzottius varieornatus]